MLVNNDTMFDREQNDQPDVDERTARLLDELATNLVDGNATVQTLNVSPHKILRNDGELEFGPATVEVEYYAD